MLLHRWPKKKLMITTIVSIFLLIGGGKIQAQDTEFGIATPDSLPPEIAEMFGEMESTDTEIAIAPSSEPQDIDEYELGADATTKNHYFYTTLRVISKSSPRGCGYSDWNCMTRLCKSDLRDSSAWRGWSGCWKRNGWICYFECGQRRSTF